MNEKNMNYSIGLDIGTNSVGFAVIDDNYKLVKKNHHRQNRNLWGSRLFNAGNSASKRRIYRSTRRRYNKRRERIRLLKMLMSSIINEIDPSFFIRLENLTFLDKEDKYLRADELNVKSNQYNLFIEKEFNDLTYYKQFPTIYHLRQHLIESKEKQDPRLIYLACHHILKYRGHFLYEGKSFDINNTGLGEMVNRCFNLFLESMNQTVDFNDEQIDTLKNILTSKVTNQTKSKEVVDFLVSLIGTKENKKMIKEIANAIVGLNFNVSDLVNDNQLLDEEGKKIKLNFDSTYDDKIVKLESALSQYLELINSIKSINDWMTLYDILNGQDTLSQAMIDKYESHKFDLNVLKEFLKQKNTKEYYNFFKNKNEKDNYYNYINNPSMCNYENMGKKVIKLINNEKGSKFDVIRQKIELGKLFIKQTSKDNAVIPYQLNEKELEIILNNQERYYDEIKENKDKIISIMNFKIPYYYGPLNPMNLDNHWIVKKEGLENERITPWNHSIIVDRDKTAENFITRMTNYCTYFVDEPVLPKNSLIVCQFEVLNELNKIRINDRYIPVDLKNRIFNDLFMHKSKVTDQMLKKYLKDNGEYLNCNNLDIKGYQKDKCFSTSLKPWIDFTSIFGKIDQNNFEMIESIIYDITVFNDKSILEERLKRKYNLNNIQINQILHLKYTGWSRLSRKLLFNIYTPYNGEPKLNIIDIMFRTNMNLMEIINNDKMKFKQIIQKANTVEHTGKFTYEEVQQLQGSPAIKKSIWQALQIIDEIIKIMKCSPQNIFIEFAREEGVKKRSISRVNLIKKYLNEVDCKNKKELMKQLNLEKKESISDRKYLYYMQLGKCMYSGEPLIYSDLDKYDIDHIIPRTLIKDDSLDNRVLVKKMENQYKSDQLVVAYNTRNKMISFWKKLFDLNLISSKKFNALTRSEFKSSDIEKFIQRQIVETRQITKHVAQIVDNHLPQTKVMTIRAGLSHDFRIKYNIYKNRNLNDFHHAHDAYIASILGLYIQKRYPKIEKQFIYGDYMKLQNKEQEKKNKYGFILNSMNKDYVNSETGEIIWCNQYLSSIINSFNYKDCFISKKLEEFSGELFDATVYKNDKHSDKGKTVAKVAVNKLRSNIHKYGGYKGLNYFPVAIRGEHIKKKTEIKLIAKVPLMYKNSTQDKLIEYLLNEHKDLTNIEVIKLIKENQLLEIDQCLYFLASPNELNNAQQLLLSLNNQKTLFYVNEAIKKQDYNIAELQDIQSLYDELCQKMLCYYPKLKNRANDLIGQKETFNDFSKEIQCKIIVELLKATKSGKERGEINFTQFKYASFGRISVKNLKLDSIVFVDQSITGFYEKRYTL